MIRCKSLESAGLRLAALSDRMDGDCSSHPSSIPARQAYLSRCGAPFERLTCAKQTHGTQVFLVEETDAGKGANGFQTALGEGDGLITRTVGIPLGITVADCVPVYVYDALTPAVGIFHAGREGTQSNITGAGIRAMMEKFGSQPSHLYGWIGPSAGRCCYEVSESLAESFALLGLPVEGRYLDLWSANRNQMVGMGMLPERITVTEQCTICGGAYFSYRRDGTGSRNLGIIML